MNSDTAFIIAVVAVVFGTLAIWALVRTYTNDKNGTVGLTAVSVRLQAGEDLARNDVVVPAIVPGISEDYRWVRDQAVHPIPPVPSGVMRHLAPSSEPALLLHEGRVAVTCAWNKAEALRLAQPVVSVGALSPTQALPLALSNALPVVPRACADGQRFLVFGFTLPPTIHLTASLFDVDADTLVITQLAATAVVAGPMVLSAAPSLRAAQGPGDRWVLAWAEADGHVRTLGVAVDGVNVITHGASPLQSPLSIHASHAICTVAVEDDRALFLMSHGDTMQTVTLNLATLEVQQLVAPIALGAIADFTEIQRLVPISASIQEYLLVAYDPIGRVLLRANFQVSAEATSILYVQDSRRVLAPERLTPDLSAAQFHHVSVLPLTQPGTAMVTVASETDVFRWIASRDHSRPELVVLESEQVRSARALHCCVLNEWQLLTIWATTAQLMSYNAYLTNYSTCTPHLAARLSSKPVLVDEEVVLHVTTPFYLHKGDEASAFPTAAGVRYAGIGELRLTESQTLQFRGF